MFMLASNVQYLNLSARCSSWHVFHCRNAVFSFLGFGQRSIQVQGSVGNGREVQRSEKFRQGSPDRKEKKTP